MIYKPGSVRARRRLKAIHPDAFVLSLCEVHLDQVVQVMHTHRTSLRRPSKSPEEYLAVLVKAGLTQTVAALRGRQAEL